MELFEFVSNIPSVKLRSVFSPVSTGQVLKPLALSVRFQGELEKINNLPQKTTWKSPSRFAKARKTFYEVLLVVASCVTVANFIPVPQSWQPAKISTLLFARKPMKPLMNLLLAEWVLYCVIRKRRSVLAHELGHSLVFRQMSKKWGFHPDQDKKAKTVLTNTTWGGFASRYTVQYHEMVSAFRQRAEKMLKNPKKVHELPEADREMAKILVKDDIFCSYAGALLQGYLTGSTFPPFSDIADKLNLYGSARLLADLEKPRGQWQWGERKAFIQCEVKQGYEKAKAFLIHFECEKIKALHEAMVKQKGKNAWTQFEMEALIQQVGLDG